MEPPSSPARGPAGPASAPARRRALLLPLLLAGAIVLAYAGSFSGSVQFDDHADIGRSVQSFSGDPPPILELLRERRFSDYDRRLLTDLTLVLNHRLGGFETFGYHVLNVAVHVCVALVLFGLLRRTLRLAPPAGRWASSATTLAFVIALLFGVHPLTTQAVDYIVQRAEALMALFYLLALYGLLRASQARRGAALWVGLVWAAGLCGVTSKEVMVSAPLVALLFDHVFLRGRGGRAARLAAHAGLWLAVLGYLSWSGFFEKALVADSRRVTEIGLSYRGTTPWGYLLTQCEVLLHYVRLAFWPSGLVLDYGWRFVERPSEVLLEGLLLASLFVASVVLLVRRHWAGFCGCAFFLVLAPTSSVVPIADAAFEHRMYLPLAAVLTLAVGGALALLERLLDDRRAALRALVGLCVVASAALALATHARHAVYRSELAMWSDVVEKRPQNARGLSNLSKVQLDLHMPDAGDLARRSLAIDPSNPKAHYDLGLSLERAGDVRAARASYEQALALDPDQVEARTALGMLLLNHWHDPEGALLHMQLALRIAPKHALVRYNMGFLQQAGGNLQQAIGFYDQALALDPGYLPSAIMKALCQEGLEQLPLAEATLRAALERAQPERDRAELVKIHTNLGTVLFKMQRFEEAGACYERALAIDARAPNVQVVWHNLGLVREQLGQRAAAVAAYRQALAVAPDYADAQAGLARLGG